MKNKFAGLERLGLSHLIINDENNNTENNKAGISDKLGKQIYNENLEEEKAILFDKTYVCPICGNEFKSKTVKVGKAKLDRIEMDLRPVYTSFDVLKYDALACDSCGYAALTRYFNFLNETQKRVIKEKIKIDSEINNSVDVFSYDDAILRHKKALETIEIKKAFSSERAYVNLKLAWLTRGKKELLQVQDGFSEEIKALSEIEDSYILKAYEGFRDSFSKEKFPIAGMDEPMFTYLCADLARKCKDYEASKRFIENVLISKTASQKVKEKARDLFEIIKKEVNKGE